MPRGIKIGVSACLLGDKVRFDTGHKKSHFCAEELSAHVEYVKFCPEMAIGLGTPRPTIRQVRKDQLITVCQPDGSGDVGEKLSRFGQQVAETHLDALSGFIFCAKSPSCGMERVKVYNEAGTGNTSEGVGFFAAQIMKANPQLPCEENGRLNDMHLRENFIARVWLYKHWQTLCLEGLSIHRLTQFHARYKYMVMSHNYEAYRALGRYLGSYGAQDINDYAHGYISGLMNAMKKPASRKNQANTLTHLQGYFKNQLSSAEKQELSRAIDEYRTGLVPLFVPLTLLKHHLGNHPNDYLSKQVYFDPYPAELKLRYGI